MDQVIPLEPRRVHPAGRRPRRWRAWVLFGLVPAGLVVVSLIRLWVDLLWFAELGQRDVLVTRIEWGTAMGFGAGIAAFAVIHANLVLARRVGRDDLYVPFLAGSNPDAPEQPTVPHFVIKPILLGISLIVSLLVGLVMSGTWETVLRFAGRSDFGVRDPHFGHDASFYVFTVPMFELVVGFLLALTVLTGLLVGIAYVAMGVIRYTPLPRIARAASIHLAAILAAFLVIEAADYRIEVWNLVLSRHGAATGVGYTDAHARLPALWAMAVLSLVIAIAVVVFARRGRWRRAGYCVVGWVGAAVLLGSVVPGLMQTAIVEPNELDREQHVLRGNIDLTRVAYGLDKVAKRAFTDEAKLNSGDFARNTDTTSNIRLWSPEVLNRAIEQLQTFRGYYGFNDVDVDRYTIDGDYRQVMLAVRELDPLKLDEPSWVSQRLQYTHGYGMVAAWPNRSTETGQPELLLRNIPPTPVDQNEIELTRPEVYFGELTSTPVVVNSRQKEFDYPEGESNKLTRYSGRGGIRISGFPRRLALAVALGDGRLLLTGAVTSQSRYMFNRNVKDRVHKLAPFLEFDQDPYAVEHDGRIVWIQDAFTTSDRFPYSHHTPLEQAAGREVNYIRNSVKAVVDAYDGRVVLYVTDSKDPVLRSWQRAFPSLFTAVRKMPEDLRAHLRYPERLFDAQTDIWLKYHMGEVQPFYTREDLWEVPTVGRDKLHSFYIMARLPGEQQEEMLLVRPAVPNGKKNLIAYMVVRMDGERYGELITFTLPKQSLTQGPQQVSALIKQDPEISQQLKLWEGQDNVPILGNLLILPIENSLLYVQPVYLESQEANLPEFERVVVVLGDTIAWGESFEAAVQSLLDRRGEPKHDGQPDAGPGGSDSGATGSDGDGGDAPVTGTDAAALRRTLDQVGRHYDRAIECQRAGDWACYGRETREIQRLLADSGVAKGV